MKKYFSFLTIAALGVLAISCAKEVEFNNKENTGKSISMVFSATLETDDDATKTALQDDNKVNWSKDDQILAVWDGGSKGSEALTEGGASASFTVNDMEGNPQYAVYPSTLTSSYDGASFKVTIPSTQDGSFSKAAVEVAQVSDSDLAFKNLGGLMKLTITSADVRTVTISSNDGTALAGKATVTFDTAGVPSVASVEEGTSTVTLSFTGEPSTEEPYYVAVLPCELKAGVYIEFKNGEGTVIGEKMTGKTLSVARRQICNFGEVTIVTITDKYFVTVGGNGLKDGSSWENAADYAALKAHLTQNSVKNKKIYMAAGTYTSTESVTITNTSFSIFGGYPISATGTSLAGRDISVNKTIFDGAGTYSIFSTNSSSINAVFDGVSFQNATNSTGGSALIFTQIASATINSCVFENNKNTYSGGTDNGGIVYLADGNIAINKCVFSGNDVENGVASAIYVAGGTVKIDGCYFNGNKSKSRGVIRLASNSSKVFINNSAFIDNTSSSVCTDILVTKGLLAVNNCSFYHSATMQFPSVYNSAKTLIVNSSLQGQISSANGVVYNTGASASLYIANNFILNRYKVTSDPKPAVAAPFGSVTSYGHNAFFNAMPASNYTVESSTSHPDFNTASSYLLGWNDSEHILWKSNNTLPAGFTRGTPARVLEAIQAFDTANPSAGVATWLNGAYLKDALGTTRKTEGCWPGAYEGK
jgi:hypothetical protein